MRKYSICLASIIMLCSAMANAEPGTLLSSIFQDHAVLQRDKPLAVWGQAKSGDEITVTLGSSSIHAKADATGHWSAALPAISHGGPLSLTAQSSSGATQTINDVLIGDVFLCSGQSNMELSVDSSDNAPWEIAPSANNTIRMLTVPKTASIKPLESIAHAEWQIAGPATVGHWSAACYYFARQLQKTINVPIGLVHASWGGSNIRPWISAAGFKALGGYDEALKTLQEYAASEANAQQDFGKQWEAWWRKQSHDKPGKEPWNNAAYDANKWRVAPAQLGDYQSWGIPDLASFTGLLWFRTSIHLTAKQAKSKAILHLGGVDEVDETWINGKIIGNSFGYGAERVYDIPAGVLHAGDNTLLVNVTNSYASGGLVGDFKRAVTFADGESVPLTGEWKYLKVASDIGYPPGAPWTSVTGITTMYNGMIAPLGHYGIRSALWYQGESNTGEPQTYQSLLAALFADWRTQFGKDLPFLVVQLPDYGPRTSTPVESGWAGVREAERLAVKNDPHAGLAVTIDIGQPNDLHPPDKQDVGIRLAHAARHVIYGENNAPSGPVPLSVHRDASAVTVTFGDIDKALVAYSYTGPISFELCGAASSSCQFATAHIDGTKVTLTAPNMQSATRVRYCWADSPICNLYDDGNGLPAGPFEMQIQ